MKKELDTDQITNELKGQSLYFEDQSKRLAKKSDDKPANARTGERPNARTSERTNARTSERTNARTRVRNNVKRIIKRHSYQFYIDQVEDIKSLWISYQARGMDIELSDLAREAFDAYLTRIKEKANERANARTSERANARTSERTNARTSERANGRTSERANGRTQKKRLDKGK